MRFTSSALVALLAMSQSAAAASCNVVVDRDSNILLNWDIWADNVYGSAKTSRYFLLSAFSIGYHFLEIYQLIFWLHSSGMVWWFLGQSQEPWMRPFAHLLWWTRVLEDYEHKVHDGFDMLQGSDT